MLTRTMHRQRTAPVRPEPGNAGRTLDAPAANRRPAAPSRRFLTTLAAVVVVAALVRVWESDWMLERQAAHASPADLRAMAERMPGSYIVHYHLGKALAEARAPSEAIDELAKARQLDPDSARVVTLLADQLEREARFSEAGALTETFARTHPNSAEAQYALGVYLYRVFARPRATEALRRSVQLDPRDARAWRVLGEAYLGQDRFGEAIDALTKALEVEPRDLQTRIRRGMALASNNEIPRSETDLRAAVQVDPKSPEARFALADMLAVHGHGPESRREAETLFRSLLAESSKSVEAELALGKLLSSQGRWQEAEPHLAAYTSARPYHTEGLYLYGQTLRSLRKPSAEVFARFEGLKKVEVTRRNLLSTLQMQSDNVALRIKLARLLAANGEPAFAIVCYERALRLSPNEQVRKELAELRARVNGGLALAQ